MFSKVRSQQESKNTPKNSPLPIVSEPWHLLIVDDEPDVHSATRLAIAHAEFEGRKVVLHSAYSGTEAQQLLSERDDFALVLLDVVMETNHAGLEVVKYIRQKLSNTMIRIILRTGQPGEAPEEQVFIDYDINDYKEKTELDRKRLFVTIYSAIRAYRDLQNLESSRKFLLQNRLGLEKVIHASAQLFNSHSLDEFANGLLEQVTALLFLESNSLVAHSSGLTAISNTLDGWEIISASNNFKEQDINQNTKINNYFKTVCQQKASLFDDGNFVGYFCSLHGRVILVYLEKCGDLDDLQKALLNVFSVNVSIALENIFLEKEITETQDDVLFRLTDFLETRSKETGNHVKRLSELSYLLALKLGLPEEEAELIHKASVMHDVGKIAIPDAILLKPGRLTPEEYEVMKQHAEIGYTVLNGSKRPLLQTSAIIAHQHHEHYDGSGYPQGLKGEEINFYARIVAIIDVFDALMHHRYYKSAWSLERVLETLKAERGKHFDPTILDRFLNMIPEAMVILNQYQDNP